MCIDDLNSASEGSEIETALLNAIAVWGIGRGLDNITGSLVTREGFYENLVRWYRNRGLSVQNGWLVGESRVVRDRTLEILAAHGVSLNIHKS